MKSSVFVQVEAHSLVSTLAHTALAARWGQPGSGGNEPYGLVADGIIDVLDVIAAARRWGEVCP